MSELEFDRVVGIARRYQESRILLSACELDLFAILGEASVTPEQIAEPRGWDVPALRVLLDALTASGFIEKTRAGYAVARVNRELFSVDDSRRMIHILRYYAANWSDWSSLTARVVQGGEPARTPSVIDAVQAAGVAVRPLTPGIAALVRPEMGRSFLDVGGGTGAFTVAFLERDRTLRATLIDDREVVEFARRLLDADGYGEFVRLVAADIVADPWPDSHDLVFLSAVLHSRPPDAARTILRRAFQSLNSGGRVVIRDHVMSDDRLLPRAGALCAVHNLVCGPGAGPYSYRTMCEWLRDSGFADSRLLQDGERVNGIVEAFKP